NLTFSQSPEVYPQRAAAPSIPHPLSPGAEGAEGPQPPVTIHDMFSFPLLIAACATLALAQDPISPHSAFEPPAAKAAASLAASTKASPADLLTTGEKSDWNETGPYSETVEIAYRLEKASRFVKVLDMGTTPEGRTMIALVVSKDRAFTPNAAAKTNKAVIF